jgi:hypothetical protein
MFEADHRRSHPADGIEGGGGAERTDPHAAHAYRQEQQGGGD